MYERDVQKKKTGERRRSPVGKWLSNQKLKVNVAMM
jgi:hypothetical protein